MASLRVGQTTFFVSRTESVPKAISCLPDSEVKNIATAAASSAIKRQRAQPQVLLAQQIEGRHTRRPAARLRRPAWPCPHRLTRFRLGYWSSLLLFWTGVRWHRPTSLQHIGGMARRHGRSGQHSASRIGLPIPRVVSAGWQGQRESNPQPSVLETDALPIELCPCSLIPGYSMILATTPAPTVRPPSRMAKRRPSSMAIGLISLTVMLTLSPGITISLSLGSSTAPVTSVVRK